MVFIQLVALTNSCEYSLQEKASLTWWKQKKTKTIWNSSHRRSDQQTAYLLIGDQITYHKYNISVQLQHTPSILRTKNRLWKKDISFLIYLQSCLILMSSNCVSHVYTHFISFWWRNFRICCRFDVFDEYVLATQQYSISISYNNVDKLNW